MSANLAAFTAENAEWAIRSQSRRALLLGGKRYRLSLILRG